MPQQPTDQDGDTVLKAMALIDPSGTLVPGSEAYDIIRGMIVRWIDDCGPDHALYMARQSGMHFEKWIRCH